LQVSAGVRWTTVEFAKQFGIAAMAVLLVGCGEDEQTCPDTLESYCDRKSCPSSPQEVLEAPCDYPQVFTEGDAIVIGAMTGSGGRTFHFLKGRLVGVYEYTDQSGGACPRVQSFGTQSIGISRLMLLLESDPRCTAEDQAECVSWCTFCEGFDEGSAMCSQDVLD
jgi:hypothetical protein